MQAKVHARDTEAKQGGDGEKPAGFMTSGFNLKFLRNPQFFHEHRLSEEETVIQKKVFYPNILYSAVIPPGFHIVPYNHDFSEGIGDSDQ